MNNNEPVPPTPRRRKLKTAWKEGTAFLLNPAKPAPIRNAQGLTPDTALLVNRRELPRHGLR